MSEAFKAVVAAAAPDSVTGLEVPEIVTHGPALEVVVPQAADQSIAADAADQRHVLADLRGVERFVARAGISDELTEEVAHRAKNNRIGSSLTLH